MRYAQDTAVSVERSRAEIETTLRKYGASAFGYACDDARGLAEIQFASQGRYIKFRLRLPARDDKAFSKTPGGRRMRTPDERYKAWEQACRQRWRALALCIKAKLEAVACGIAEFEDEFMAQIVLPNGQTVSDFVRPQLAIAYKEGKMPAGIVALLPAPEGAA